MSLVRGAHTGPEMLVRRLVHGLGYRYRLHVSALPGKPDLVFPAKRKVIFVHGCFWHRHKKSCPLTRMPKSRLDFWTPKLIQNRERDAKHRRLLRAQGWAVLTLWECELKNSSRLTGKIVKFLKR
jgi:DNA mismatch endonuclease, patch repair protein